MSDSAAPGLRLRISTKGARIFRWYVHTPTGRRVLTIGRWSKAPRPGHVTLAEARGWLERLKEAHREGRLAEVEAELQALRPRPVKASAPAEGAPTVKDVAAAFLLYMEKVRRRPEQARRPIECDLLPALGDRPVASVTTQDVRRVVEAVVARGSPRQAGVVLAVVRQLLNFALDRGDLETNPADRLRNPAALGIEAGMSQRFLNAAEIPAFWRALAAHKGLTPTVKIGLRLLLLTAARSGELLKARVEDVDLEAATWTIPVRNQKLTRARERHARPFIIPLAPMAAELMGQLKALAKSLDSPFLMASFHATQPGEALTDKALTAGMRKLFVGAKPLLQFEGERPTPHDLRRSARTHLGELGVAWHTCERTLNHSLGKIAATYDLSDNLPERRAALEKWERHLARLIDPASNVVALPTKRGAK